MFRNASKEYQIKVIRNYLIEADDSNIGLIEGLEDLINSKKDDVEELAKSTDFVLDENTKNTVVFIGKKALEDFYYEEYIKQREEKMSFTAMANIFTECFRKYLEDSEQVDDLHFCNECDKHMIEGYSIDSGDEHYCSDECLNKHYTSEEYSALYAGLDNTDEEVLERMKTINQEELDDLHWENQSTTYWTDWR